MPQTDINLNNPTELSGNDSPPLDLNNIQNHHDALDDLTHVNHLQNEPFFAENENLNQQIVNIEVSSATNSLKFQIDENLQIAFNNESEEEAYNQFVHDYLPLYLISPASFKFSVESDGQIEESVQGKRILLAALYENAHHDTQNSVITQLINKDLTPQHFVRIHNVCKSSNSASLYADFAKLILAKSSKAEESCIIPMTSIVNLFIDENHPDASQIASNFLSYICYPIHNQTENDTNNSSINKKFHYNILLVIDYLKKGLELGYESTSIEKIITLYSAAGPDSESNLHLDRYKEKIINLLIQKLAQFDKSHDSKSPNQQKLSILTFLEKEFIRKDSLDQTTKIAFLAICKFWTPLYQNLSSKTIKHIFQEYIDHLDKATPLSNTFDNLVDQIFADAPSILMALPHIQEVLATADNNKAKETLIAKISKLDFSQISLTTELTDSLLQLAINPLSSTLIVKEAISTLNRNGTDKILDLVEGLSQPREENISLILEYYQHLTTNCAVSKKLIFAVDELLNNFSFEKMADQTKDRLLRVIRNLAIIYPSHQLTEQEQQILADHPQPIIAPEFDQFTLTNDSNQEPSIKSTEALINEMKALNNSSSIIHKLIEDGTLISQYNHIKKRAAEQFSASNETPIQSLTKQQLAKWASTHKLSIENYRKTKTNKPQLKLAAAIAIISQANYLTTSHYPRDVQIFALLSLIAQSNQGALLQVATGEGKSTITAMLAAYKALNGEQVDVATSSNILAERDAHEREEFFNLLGLTVAHNNDVSQASFKECYKADIVYGTAANFQYDILRHEFSRQNTRGNRKNEVIIVDEVDSMLIDNGATIAMLASPITSGSFLAPVYAKIWHNYRLYSSNFIMHEGILRYKNEKIRLIKNDNSLDSETENNNKDPQFETITNYIPVYETKKEYLLKLISRDVLHAIENEQIRIPKHLHQYARHQMRIWIENAMKAELMTLNKDYIIKPNQNNDNVICPVDYVNTGTVSNSSNWGDGLHQFLQLKHGLKITPEILTTNFMSNYSFFKRYKENIFGMTGTLGGQDAKNLLAECYGINFGYIPTFKEKRFTDLGISQCSDQLEWQETIVAKTTAVIMQKRSVLLICNSIAETLDLQQILLERHPHVIVYSRDDTQEKESIAGQLNPGQIIIATNLAGRGTDLKLSKAVAKFGGLHVILTFLPNNLRVEEQAFGRAARQGQMGSGEIIINNQNYEELLDEVYHKSQLCRTPFGQLIKEVRDDLEAKRLEELKKKNLPEIEIAEEIFSKTCDLFNKLNNIESNQEKLKQIEENWGFKLKRIHQAWQEMNASNTDISINQNEDEDADIDDKTQNNSSNINEKRQIALAKFEEFAEFASSHYKSSNIYSTPSLMVRWSARNMGRVSFSNTEYLLRQAAKLDEEFSMGPHYTLAYNVIRGGTQKCRQDNKVSAEYMMDAHKFLRMTKADIEAKFEPMLQFILLTVQLSEESQITEQIQKKMKIYSLQKEKIDSVLQKIEELHKEGFKKKFIVINKNKPLRDFFEKDKIPEQEISDFENYGIYAIFEVDAESIKVNWWAFWSVIAIAIGEFWLGCLATVTGNLNLAGKLFTMVYQDLKSAYKLYNLDMTGSEYFSQKALSLGIDILFASAGNLLSGVTSNITKGSVITDSFDLVMNQAAGTANIASNISVQAITEVGVHVAKDLGAQKLADITLQHASDKLTERSRKEVSRGINNQFSQHMRSHINAQKLNHLLFLDALSGSNNYYKLIFEKGTNFLDSNTLNIQRICRSLLSEISENAKLNPRIRVAAITINVLGSIASFNKLTGKASEIADQIMLSVNDYCDKSQTTKLAFLALFPDSLRNDKAVHSILKKMIEQGIISKDYQLVEDYEKKFDALVVDEAHKTKKVIIGEKLKKLYHCQSQDYSEQSQMLISEVGKVLEEKIQFMMCADVINPLAEKPLTKAFGKCIDTAVKYAKGKYNQASKNWSKSKTDLAESDQESSINDHNLQEFLTPPYIKNTFKDYRVRLDPATNDPILFHNNEDDAIIPFRSYRVNYAHIYGGLDPETGNFIPVEKSISHKLYTNQSVLSDAIYSSLLEDSWMKTTPEQSERISNEQLKKRYDNLPALQKMLSPILSGISEQNLQIKQEYHNRMQNDKNFAKYVQEENVKNLLPSCGKVESQGSNAYLTKEEIAIENQTLKTWVKKNLIPDFSSFPSLAIDQTTSEMRNSELYYHMALLRGGGQDIFLDKKQRQLHQVKLNEMGQSIVNFPTNVASTIIKNTARVGNHYSNLTERYPILASDSGKLWVVGSAVFGGGIGLFRGGFGGGVFGFYEGLKIGLTGEFFGLGIQYVAGEQIQKGVSYATDKVANIVKLVPDVTDREAQDFSIIGITSLLLIFDVRSTGRHVNSTVTRKISTKNHALPNTNSSNSSNILSKIDLSKLKAFDKIFTKNKINTTTNKATSLVKSTPETSSLNSTAKSSTNNSLTSQSIVNLDKMLTKNEVSHNINKLPKTKPTKTKPTKTKAATKRAKQQTAHQKNLASNKSKAAARVKQQATKTAKAEQQIMQAPQAKPSNLAKKISKPAARVRQQSTKAAKAEQQIMQAPQAKPSNLTNNASKAAARVEQKTTHVSKAEQQGTKASKPEKKTTEVAKAEQQTTHVAKVEQTGSVEVYHSPTDKELLSVCKLYKCEYKLMNTAVRAELRAACVPYAKFIVEQLYNMSPTQAVYKGVVTRIARKLAEGRVDNKIFGLAQLTDELGHHKSAIEILTHNALKNPNTLAVIRSRAIKLVIGKRPKTNVIPDLMIMKNDGTVVLIEIVSPSQTIAEMDLKFDMITNDLIDIKNTVNMKYKIYEPAEVFDKFLKDTKEIIKIAQEKNG